MADVIQNQKERTEAKPKTLMLIDDKEVSNFILKKNITIYLPYTKTVEYTDPDMALKSLDSVNPDLIFLDLGLPMIEDGWEFLDQMQAMGSHYKVAVLTSSISNEDYDKAMSYANVVSFVSKPIFGEELQAIVRRPG
ncbi:MAG: response regulator [Owenweeksia sp.]|nr:response regulator [Owenweeksia sp.]